MGQDKNMVGICSGRSEAGRILWRAGTGLKVEMVGKSIPMEEVGKGEGNLRLLNIRRWRILWRRRRKWRGYKRVYATKFKDPGVWRRSLVNSEM